MVRKQLTLILAQQLLTSYSCDSAASFRSPESLLTLPNLDYEQAMRKGPSRSKPLLGCTAYS